MAVNVSKWDIVQSMYAVGARSSHRSCEDDQDKDNWRLEINVETNQVIQVDLKMAIKGSVRFIFTFYFATFLVQ